MKRFIMTVFLLLFSTGCVWAQRAVPTTATFVVKDDAGQVVANVNLEGGFRDVSNAGSRDRFKGITNTNGIFVVEGNAVTGVGGRFWKDGYYETITSAPIDYEKKESMSHWDVEIPVVLKRIRNQIPMYVKTVENIEMRKKSDDKMGKYVLNSVVGYDLVKGDYTAPYGKGEVADMEFKWKMTIYKKDKYGMADDYDTLCEIRMPNALDGICRGKPDGVRGNGSAFISDYNAPEDGYQQLISLYRNVRGSKAESNDDQHYLYYFRIRTKTDGTGKITSALYGKTYGQINDRFTYYLNPTPNDRNVEEDRNQNLFPGKNKKDK